MRLMCMSCSRFFSMNHPLEHGKTQCPFCRDMYFCDNIDPQIPPPLCEESTIRFECGHTFNTDMVLDIVCCPVCGNENQDRTVSMMGGISLSHWQNSILEEIGV